MSSTVTVHHGDSRNVLKTLADASIDSVVTDPPYALVSIGKRFGADNAAPAKEGRSGVYARASAGFMGQKWDTGETAFSVEFWAEVMRVLKPGGHVLAASGTRTYHRLACAVEDAGFEIRDMVPWLYGSGFPKSHDVSKGIDKAAGKARGRNLDVRNGPNTNQTTKGQPNTVGGYASDAPLDQGPVTPEAAQWQGWGTALKPACEPWVLARKPLEGTVAANVLAHGTGALNVDGCRVGIDDAERGVIDNRSGAGFGTGQTVGAHQGRSEGVFTSHSLGRWPANVIHDGSDEVLAGFPEARGATSNSAPGGMGYGSNAKGLPEIRPGYADQGSAARFFYTSKATKADRLGSGHPTVKPVDLMAYLTRLITPPGGVVLDPFAGSGSTGVACYWEGFDAILIEREERFFADIERRLAHARGEGRLTADETKRKEDVAADALGPLLSVSDATVDHDG